MTVEVGKYYRRLGAVGKEEKIFHVIQSFDSESSLLHKCGAELLVEYPSGALTVIPSKFPMNSLEETKERSFISARSDMFNTYRMGAM